MSFLIFLAFCDMMYIKSSMDYRYQEDIPVGPLRDSIISYGSLGPLLTLGDRVVWVLRDGPQFGWVRWVGRLPDVTEDGWTIGVEFDNPVGSGDGRFAGKRYFFGRQDRALFLPNTNLVRAEEYHLQLAKQDGFGAGNQQVVVPPYTTLPSRNSAFNANCMDMEPQSETCSASATPVQNKRSVFSAFKLKKSKSLQETVEDEAGYDNVKLKRKEKSHFHLLPLRFPKSSSNSSVSSAPPNFGPPRVAGAEQLAEDSSMSGEESSLMSCLPSLGGSLLRRRRSKKNSKSSSPKKQKTKGKRRANDQTPAFAFLTTTADGESTTSSLVSNVTPESSRQHAMLQQYRDSLEARNTPKLERKLPHLANPQPGTSAEVQLFQVKSQTPTIVNSQQARKTKIDRLEQRRSLLTPIIPPDEDFDYLDLDKRSNSLQITRNRSPIAPFETPSSLPLEAQVVKKKKKRKAPAPPTLNLTAAGSSDGHSFSSGSESFQRRLKKKAPSPPTKTKVEKETNSAPPESPRLNDLSRIDEDAESEFEFVLRRSESKVNDLVGAFQRLTESSGELSPEARSDDGTITPILESEASSSTSTKWRYVDVSDTISVDSNTSEPSARRDSVSEYRLEFERRRAFYETKNREASSGRAAACSKSGGGSSSNTAGNRNSRSFDEPSQTGQPNMSSFKDILKSHSSSSIASKGSTASDKRPPIHPDSPTGTRQFLYKQLETAISKGEHDKAASLARQLALNKKKISTITINLYVEDKLSHVGPIRLVLNPAITLRQLKQKIQADYRFPEARQRWVIGSGLAMDNERTLEEMGIQRNDANLFLYLVSASKYGNDHNPGTPKSLPREFLDSFPSSIRHIIPEKTPRRTKLASKLQRAESIDSDETWQTTSDFDNNSPESSTARVRKRRQIIRSEAEQSVDKLNKLLKCHDTLKGWKCELCGMTNRRAGQECVMCGSLYSATSNDADDERFDGSLDDINNFDRLSINKVHGEKISPDLSPIPKELLSGQDLGRVSVSSDPRSRSRSPPRSPVFVKALLPASMPVPAHEKQGSNSAAKPKSPVKSQIPRPIFVSDSSPSPPRPLRPKTPPSADVIWHTNPCYENKNLPCLAADLAVEENFNISSDSGSDGDESVTSFEVNERMFTLDDGDELGRITDELGLTEPHPRRESSSGVKYRANGENANHAGEGRSERPTTAIFRPAQVNNAFLAEGAMKSAEMKHALEEPPRCISETTFSNQPQRAVLHMETGARPKHANIVKIKTGSPPPVPFKPLVTVEPWATRKEKDLPEKPQGFAVEVATTRDIFEGAIQTARLCSLGDKYDHSGPDRRKSEHARSEGETNGGLKEAIETLRTLTESPVKDYLKLMQLDDHDVVANTEEFECPVCFTQVGPHEGVVLRDCLHTFCKECLQQAVDFCTEATVKCPFMNMDYSCESYLQEREIKALVSEEIYEKHLRRSMKQAETAAQNSFHCKTPDCAGWCFFEDNVNNFDCPVCSKRNCMTCQAIHDPLNCLQYQDQLELDAELTDEAKKTKAFLDDMVRCNDAMHCPHCRIILIRKWGCDWVKCSMCKTEICWVTKGPRWGPAGRGDTSGGCKCGVKGVKCHPKCTYCH